MRDRFLAASVPALKICGVTCAADAGWLAELGVEALGVNFWPGSARFVDPSAAGWLAGLAGRILRVGVFVNAGAALPARLVAAGLLDLVQLHGDETKADVAPLVAAGIPLLKALGLDPTAGVPEPPRFPVAGVLLDAHAPGRYGGTGTTADWPLAAEFRARHPEMPVVLAGGLGPANAAAALAAVRPAALDVASGAESSPGVKDRALVQALVAIVRRAAAGSSADAGSPATREP